MIDEIAADLCGESVCSETDLYSFPRWRKIESTILCGHGRAMIGHRRRFVRHPWLIEIFSNRVFDPFAVSVRGKGIAADRRFRSDRAIGMLEEQIQTKSSVSHSILAGDYGGPNNRAFGHDSLHELISPVNGR